MHTKRASKSGPQAKALVAAAVLLLGSISSSAFAAGVGSDNDMFKRHFWRGQAHHGAGYPAQVHEVEAGRNPSVGTVPSFDATVVEGSLGAAIAHDAAYCAGRFKSYDPASGIYIGRSGIRKRCP